MATQADLFLAVLALDAYNRGYNRGMAFAGNSNHELAADLVAALFLAIWFCLTDRSRARPTLAKARQAV